jgi:hypothetical protein
MWENISAYPPSELTERTTLEEIGRGGGKSFRNVKIDWEAWLLDDPLKWKRLRETEKRKWKIAFREASFGCKLRCKFKMQIRRVSILLQPVQKTLYCRTLVSICFTFPLHR